MIISDGKDGYTHCPGSLQTNRELVKDLKKHGFPPTGYGMDWKHNKKFKLTEKWTSTWESFAGKPYAKPKKLTRGVIAGTVKDAQELLCRLGEQASDYDNLRTRDKIIGIGMRLKQLGLIAGDF